MHDVTAPGAGPSSPAAFSTEQVLDRLDLAVIATDAEGTVVSWNARATALYGWTRREALGRHIGQLTVPADAAESAEEIMATLRRGEPWQGAFPLKRKDGSRFTAFVKDSPILDDKGALAGIVGVSIEIADPELATAVQALLSGRDGDGRRPNGRRLSPREREVLEFLARGLTGEQIAERLVLSPETVRTHIRNAREKLGASTRVEAVTMALVAREIEL